MGELINFLKEKINEGKGYKTIRMSLKKIKSSDLTYSSFIE